ncbi:MAG: Glycoside hydrolase family 57 [Candidatus Daviesbacteria bacterium GW2011_GWA2_38_24]|uniref:Glycoside hydrolase family 57 n=1 Tax=Candidatus Daviesbacteria bacterium GW2011_GWA2_38_24 TaxID=1618422 RepID=A0A0G0JJA2_9BACT|nr:MAG: Glycoside hydrolase family 57 [Candidatus Daviesbacteria bacterium GW2011_GWA2_38_24]KKQ80005.1 MAG: Glycoside hydrolase family 57 [Candidatus Daviesbacteria bacterium GW2011_GWA1_38_7]OGE24606.1 MAG: hypothetical protein A2688_00345 [Candidatus Daviesbacteria bacterium RIFCSPHIGHO2_01_FULL_38_8]
MAAVEAITQPEIGFFLHGYQPPRQIYLGNGHILDIGLHWNETIYKECYKPLLVDNPPPQLGLTFSFYGTLREWMKKCHPQEFNIMRNNLQDNARPAHIMGDPYLHIIFPLLDTVDQAMLVKIGQKAFIEDMGFHPRGFWLPETAVSNTSLNTLKQNGYDYVVLRDYQLAPPKSNPSHVQTQNGPLAVFHFNSKWSGSIAFDNSSTENGDQFLNRVKSEGGELLTFGMDLETFGHHKKDRDQFLRYILRPQVLQSHGFIPLNIAAKLETPIRETTNIREMSSWSCGHDLARWGKGKDLCNCDDPSEQTKKEKRGARIKLQHHQRRINRQLDKLDPHWQPDFINTFLASREHLFNGQDPGSGVSKLDGSTKRLFKAKMYALIGMTSCGWFFGDDKSIERDIPRLMIQQVEQLL